MKTVTGTVLSTKPISLSKAASILSKFVSAETGASQAVCAYLRRASLSFNELSQLHKEVKPHRSKDRTLKRKTHAGDEDRTRSAVSSQPELTQELSHGIGKDSSVESEEKKNKKKRGEIENFGENKVNSGIEKDGNLGVENERKKEKKQKRGIMRIEENGDVGIELEDERKKHKKKREKSRGETGIENGVGDVFEEEEERRRKKKRKSGEIEDGVQMNSEELHSKKKKKRKSERES